jgi:cytoskeletal protein CcmA (bactofilin family)
MAVGRISGPLLKSNLIRNGIDLAFETDLLYLDVNNQRIGVKKNSPQYELDINGTARTTDLIVNTVADIANVNISGNTISTTLPYLNLGTLDNVVYQNKARIDSIDIEGNVISTNSSNANLEFRPNGTGTVDVHSNMNVTGNIHATGNITADGDITLGDANTDNIVINADIASNIIPNIHDTYALGSSSKTWNDVWVEDLYAVSVNSTNLEVGGIDLTLRQGNTLYVTENGDDSHSGTHPQDPVASIVYALSIAVAGDTVLIYPGAYTEIFPITVPAGVTVKGHSLRSVTIQPTTATRYKDAFLLNGQTTVEDLMITGFFSGRNNFTIASGGEATGTFTSNVGVSPFAHAYVSGGTITNDAKTINLAVTGATYVHGTGILTVTYTGTAPANGEEVFLEGLIFSCNSGNRTFPDNGYAFRFATDFEVTSRSPYIRNVTVITAGSTTTAEDPRGFNAGDAGKGAYIDGAYATAASKEASMLFHSATFITPGVDAITATNGVRIEWLNSFTYFANRSFYCYNSNDGKYGAGKTRIRLGGITSGPFTAGQTITFTSTDSSTVVTALIASVDGDVITVAGKIDDLDGFDTTPSSISDGSASATDILNVDKRDFGAEVRMIGSASVYGNFGIVGDGDGVIVYAIGQNLAYIGNGKEVTNQAETVIQENEVVELNGAKVRYNSVDHKGDFRVGDLFYVNQDDGTVSFTASALNINLTNGATFTTGSDTTFVNGSRIDTGNLRISGNTVQSLTGDLNVDSASGTINLQDNVEITGNLDVSGNVSIGGNITIGDEASDSINIVAGINSDLIPDTASTYSLGSETNTWSNIYTDELDIDSIKITDNFITTTLSNADLDLRANGTGDILIPDNDVQIDNDLTVNTLTTLANTNITGTVTHVGNYAQTGNSNIDGDLTVTQDLDVSGAAQFEEILIDDNIITTTTSNADLELRANGTGQIRIPNNDVTFSQDLTVGETIAARNITATGTVSVNDYVISDIRIDENYIETTTSNANLELRANGTGTIYVPSNDVQIDNNLTVNGNVTVGNDLTITGDFAADDITLTGTATANKFKTGDIEVFQNVITTTNSNSDLELRANGTGSIILENFTVEANDIATTGDMTLTPGSGQIVMNATGALKLPAGNTAARPSAVAGQIRFNNETNVFEGYNGTAWIQLHGVVDLDRDTSVTAELTPGANDNTIRFNVAGTTVVDIDALRLRADKVIVDNISIDGNLISTSTDVDLNLTANGSGSVVFENFNVKDNVISNVVTDSVTTFNNTTNGYVKFDGTYGMVIPVGGNANRPPLAYTETGQMRWNTDGARTEIYDGDNWVSVAGTSSGISRAEAEDLALEIVLTLG